MHDPRSMLGTGVRMIHQLIRIEAEMMDHAAGATAVIGVHA